MSEAFFKWSPDYNVNIVAIDEQHRELVDIINHLFIAVFEREGDNAISGIVDELMTYTETHFALEEQLMREANYRDLESHMEEHRKLLEQLDCLSKRHLLAEKPIYFEMLSFLKHWLREHIQNVDTRYSVAPARFPEATWKLEASNERY